MISVKNISWLNSIQYIKIRAVTIIHVIKLKVKVKNIIRKLNVLNHFPKTCSFNVFTRCSQMLEFFFKRQATVPHWIKTVDCRKIKRFLQLVTVWCNFSNIVHLTLNVYANFPFYLSYLVCIYTLSWDENFIHYFKGQIKEAKINLPCSWGRLHRDKTSLSIYKLRTTID